MAVPVTIDVIARTQSAINAFNRLSSTLNRPLSNIRNLDGGFRRIDRIWTLLAAGSGLAMISTFVRMGNEMQKLRIQIGIFERSSARIPQVMNSIFNLASRVPISLQTLTGAFVKLKAAGLEPIADEQGNGLLKNLADGFAAMGATEEQIKRAFIGIQQIMGKGVVSMEELRQQVGEAMPLAMRAMARGLQISVAELIYIVGRGELEATRGINAMSEEFKRAFGGMSEVMKQTLGGQIQQFNTEMTRLADTMLVGSGALDRFAGIVKLVNDAIADLASPAKATKWADDLWENFRQIVIWGAEAIPTIQNLGSVLGSFVGTIASIAGSLPGEVAAGGIIGWLIYGPKGAVIGALAATVGDDLAVIAGLIQAFVSQVSGMIPGGGDIAGGITSAVSAGLLGWMIAGPSGAAVAVTASVLLSAKSLIADFLAWVSGALAGFGAQFAVWKKALSEGRANVFAINSEAIAAGRKVSEEHQKAARKLMGSWADGKKAAADYKKFVIEMLDGIEKRADKNRRERAQSQDAIRGLMDYGGLTNAQIIESEKFIRFLERAEQQAGVTGNAVMKAFEKGNTEIARADKIIGELREALAKVPEGQTDLAAGYENAIKKYTELRDRAKELNQQIADDKSSMSLDRLQNSLDGVAARLRPYIEGHDKSSQKLERHQASMDKLLVTLNRQKLAFKNATLDDKTREEGLKRIADMENLVNIARAKGLATLQRGIGLKARDKELDLQRATNAIENEVALMDARNSGNKVLEARAAAQKKVEGLLDRINDKIQAVRAAQADGLISASAANTTLQRLESVKEKLGEVGAEFVERAEFNASAFGEMMNSITSSLQSSISDAIVGLVDGTKSLKDVMLDFYKSITKAAADYIAKLIVMKAFGGDGGSGSGFGLSKALLPFGSGGLFGGGGGGLFSSFFGGFAEGGRFIVGGQSGTDMNTVGVRASSGEEITVGQPGEFTGRSGFGSGYTNITIQAVDAASVRELFMKEGSALVEALNRRGRLNRA